MNELMKTVVHTRMGDVQVTLWADATRPDATVFMYEASLGDARYRIRVGPRLAGHRWEFIKERLLRELADYMTKEVA